MKINLALASQLPTAQSGKSRSLGGEKKSPLSIPELGATGRAVSAAGRVANDIYTKMTNAQRQREATQAMVDMTTGFNEIQNKIKQPEYQDLTIKQHEKMFEKEVSTLESNVLGKIEDYKAREAMTMRYKQEASNELIKTQKIAWDREVDRSRATNTRALASFETDFINDGNPDILAKASATIDSAVSVGTYSKVEGEALKDQFNRNAFLGYWGNQINKDPIGLRTLLFKDGINKNGDLVLKDKEDLPVSFNSVSAEDRNKVINAARGAWNQNKGRLEADLTLALKNFSESYIATNDKELKKEIKDDAKTLIAEATSAGVFDKAYAIKLYDDFKNNTVITDFKRRSDDDPENTFLNTFKQSGTKKGFYVRGLEGKWVPKNRSDLTSEWGDMDEEQKRSLLLYLRSGYESWYSRRESTESRSRVALTEAMKNDLVSRENTGKGNDNIVAAIRDVYSTRPKEAEEKIEIYKQDQALASDVYDLSKLIAKASPEEQSQIFKDIREGYSGKGKHSAWRTESLINKLSSIAYRKAQALDKDPVAYVQSIAPDDYADYTPENRVKYNVSEQKRLGVPDPNIRAISNTQAESIVNQLKLMGGEEKVKQLQSLSRTYGTEWKLVYKDLVREEIPVGTQLLISLDRPEQMLIREQLGEVLDIKEADLKENLGPKSNDVVKEFESSFDDAFADYKRSVARQRGGEMDVAIIKGIKGTIKKRVMLDAQNPSVEVSDIAGITESYIDKAFPYNYQDGYRVPIQFNPDNVRYYTKFTTDRIDTLPIVGRYRALPGSPAEKKARQDEYLDGIRSNGQWVNTPDGSGLMLLDSLGKEVYFDRGNGLQRVEVPFDISKRSVFAGKSMSDVIKEYKESKIHSGGRGPGRRVKDDENDLDYFIRRVGEDITGTSYEIVRDIADARRNLKKMNR